VPGTHDLVELRRRRVAQIQRAALLNYRDLLGSHAFEVALQFCWVLTTEPGIGADACCKAQAF
jgi:hypothetical protein